MTTIASDPVAQLKLAHRATWAAGDYPAVARHIADGPVRDALIAAHVRPAARVLDVATGSGNVALHAARKGARVSGLDLVPELLEVARSRALAEGVEIEWVEGDAEALPFADASFDSVISVFGVQFTPRHQVTADEMVRVCRPGGSIGLVNWTPEGLIGEMFQIMGRYLPPAPAVATAPPDHQGAGEAGAAGPLGRLPGRTSRDVRAQEHGDRWQLPDRGRIRRDLNQPDERLTWLGDNAGLRLGR